MIRPHHRTMLRQVALALAVCVVAASVLSAAKERAWQTGIWRDVRVERPKVVFGLGRRSGSAGSPLPPAMTEIRTYVIETDDLRLELKETTTATSPHVDAALGESVTFALEKNTVYIKDAKGIERQFRVSKKALKTTP